MRSAPGYEKLDRFVTPAGIPKGQGAGVAGGGAKGIIASRRREEVLPGDSLSLNDQVALGHPSHEVESQEDMLARIELDLGIKRQP